MEPHFSLSSNRAGRSHGPACAWGELFAGRRRGQARSARFECCVEKCPGRTGNQKITLCDSIKLNISRPRTNSVVQSAVASSNSVTRSRMR